MNNNNKAMLFIGNGFDLSLGRQTGYSDFYKKSELLRQYADKGNELCKHIIANITGELWKDLECGLYKYSLEITKQFGVGNTKVAATFQKEFNELRSALFHYLTNESNKSVEAGGLVTCLMPEWKRLDLQCLSFNYTTTIALYLSGKDDRLCFNTDDSINTDVLIYRHGTLYNSKEACDNNPDEIVVGIDDSQVVELLHSFLYKTQQHVQYPTDELVKSIERQDIYIIYGCSMGDSDKFYFKTLFNPTATNKCYIIYGFKNDGITNIKSVVRQFVGDLNIFESKNKVRYIDCSKVECVKQTKDIIDSLLKS